MKIRKYIPTILLGIVFCCFSRSTFALSGFVSDQSGRGLERAMVEVEAAGQVYRGYTGAQGGFRFDNLPSNKAYTLQVKKSGYNEGAFAGNTNQAEEVLLQLQVQTVKLSLFVLTRQGKALKGAIVDGKKLGLKVTDDAGKVTFDLPYSTAYEMKASLGNYYFRSTASGILKGDEERVIAGELN
jgi:hypothetical protein